MENVIDQWQTQLHDGHVLRHPCVAPPSKLHAFLPDFGKPSREKAQYDVTSTRSTVDPRIERGEMKQRSSVRPKHFPARRRRRRRRETKRMMAKGTISGNDEEMLVEDAAELPEILRVPVRQFRYRLWKWRSKGRRREVQNRSTLQQGRKTPRANRSTRQSR